MIGSSCSVFLRSRKENISTEKVLQCSLAAPVTPSGGNWRIGSRQTCSARYEVAGEATRITYHWPDCLLDGTAAQRVGAAPPPPYNCLPLPYVHQSRGGSDGVWAAAWSFVRTLGRRQYPQYEEVQCIVVS